MAEEKKKERVQNKNLTKMGKARGLTSEEAQKIGRKGGIKSGQVRKARKTLKEELIALLGNEIDGKTMQEKMSLAMIIEAMAGNTKAFTAIRDTIGESPKNEIELSQDKPFEVNISIKKKE